MSKKSLLIAAILITATGLLVYYELRPKTILTSQLSPRAQAYLKRQKYGDGTSEWSNIKLEVTQAPTTAVVKREGCFEMIIPYPLKSIREDKDRECFGRYMLEKPRGSIVIFIEPTLNISLDDNSHVKLRRSRVDEYEEYAHKVNDKEFVIFKNKNMIFERNAFHLSDGKLLVVNATIYSRERSEDKFIEMLRSINF